jgi:hypothetical protein
MTTSLRCQSVWIEFRRAFRLWAAVIACVACWAAVGRAADTWLTNYDDALAAAERTGRPVLTVFTGSDWCLHCRNLEEKVLHTETFSRWADGRVVLLVIDLPQQGISQEERQARSRVCIKYGVRSFPSTLLIAPDGSRITGQSGYKGQSADAWVAAMEGHLPAIAGKADGQAGEVEEVLSSLDEAVETARDSKRPILLMVSRRGDAAATTRVASLIHDPEFESLARDHFVVASVPQADAASPAAVPADDLVGSAELAADGVELIVTDDGKTPLYTQSGGQSPQRIVSGLRRFLAARQAVRR